jgi:hypothetical protein
MPDLPVSLALGDVVDGTAFKAGVSGLDFVCLQSISPLEIAGTRAVGFGWHVVLSAIQVAVTMGYPAAGVMADRIS